MYWPVLCYLCRRGCASSSAATRVSSSVPPVAYCSRTHQSFPEGETHRGEKRLLESGNKTMIYKLPKYNYRTTPILLPYHMMFTTSNRDKNERFLKHCTCNMIAFYFISKSLGNIIIMVWTFPLRVWLPWSPLGSELPCSPSCSRLQRWSGGRWSSGSVTPGFPLDLCSRSFLCRTTVE